MGLYAFYWCYIFAIDSVVVKAHAKPFSSHVSNASSQRKYLIKLTHYNEKKLVKAKENLQFSHGGLSQRQASNQPTD